MDRPDFDEDLWTRIFGQAMAGIRVPPHPILASDRDMGAVAATLENASRAGVEGFVEVSQCSISGIHPPATEGLLLCNPPYGRRIGRKDKLRDLYAALGNVVRARFCDWNVGLVTSDKMLASCTRLGLKSATPFLPHGGMKVQVFLRHPVEGDSAPESTPDKQLEGDI